MTNNGRKTNSHVYVKIELQPLILNETRQNVDQKFIV